MNAVIYQSAGGKHEAKDKTLPFGYTKNAKFLRLCTRNLERLKPFAGSINNLLDGAAGVAKVRDGLIHGMLSGHDPNTGIYKFTKLDVDRKADIHEATSLTGTLAEISQATERSLTLGVMAIRILTALCDEFLGPDQPNDLTGKIIC